MMDKKIKQLVCCVSTLAILLLTSAPASYAIMVPYDEGGSAVSVEEDNSSSAGASSQERPQPKQNSESAVISNQQETVIVTSECEEQVPFVANEPLEEPSESSADTSNTQAVPDYLTYSVGRCVIPGLVDMPLATCGIAYAAGYINSGYATRFYDPYYPVAQTVIGAHYNMGFNGIKSSVPGQTYAYIDGETFVCAANFRGVNNHRLFDLNGNMINWNGPVMYTCNGSNYHDVTIVYWTKVS